MKTLEINLYSFSELSDEAKQYALDHATPEMDCTDIRESLEAICEACDLRLVNYSYGASDRNHNVIVSGMTDDLQGPRALLWFRRILVDHGYPKPISFPGICGFTGVCHDDDIAETIWDALKQGEDVASAFDRVSYKLCKICEDEEEYLRSEESLSQDDREIYTENGAIY